MPEASLNEIYLALTEEASSMKEVFQKGKQVFQAINVWNIHAMFLTTILFYFY